MVEISVFIGCYILFVFLGDYRAWTAVGGALFLLLSGTISLHTAVAELILWNVIGLFFGTLILAELFMQSKMPAVIAEWVVDCMATARGAILAICILSSLLSAFVENVAVVLIIAPIAMTLCKRLNISPVLPMIFLAMFSNVQGAATLIGDPPSMILGGYLKMTFNDFFFYYGKTSIFFFIQVGAIAATLLVAYLLRSLKQKIKQIKVETPRSWIPSLLLIAFIIILSGASFVDPDFKWFAGTVAMGLALLGLTWYTLGPHWTSVRRLVRQLDWETTFFLMGLFVIVGALHTANWIATFSTTLASILPDELWVTYVAIIAFSVLVSAFVDNVPYLLTMIPVTQTLADTMGAPLPLLVFGLLIGTCLGGNITPIGAVANIAAVSALKKEGYEIGFFEYTRYGFAFTVVAVTTSSYALWWIWQP